MSAYGLTQREQQLTRLVLQGFSTTDIADRLVISLHTVQSDLRSIFAKTGVRAGAILLPRSSLLTTSRGSETTSSGRQPIGRCAAGPLLPRSPHRQPGQAEPAARSGTREPSGDRNCNGSSHGRSDLSPVVVNPFHMGQWRIDAQPLRKPVRLRAASVLR